MDASSDAIEDAAPDESATVTPDDVSQPAAQPERSRRSSGPVDPRLVRRAKATRPYMISGVVVGSITAVLILIQATLLSGSIASVFASHSLAGLGLTLALLALVLAGRGILAWASSWLAQRTSAAVKSQLRRDILAARLGSPALQTSSSSTLVTLVTHGLDSLDGYFSKYLPQLLLAVTVPVILGAAMLVTDWRTAIIIAVTIPFIPILMMLIGWTTQKQMKRRWVFQSRLASHFADLVSGLPTLQVFGRAKAQAAGLKRTEGANRRESLSILKYAFLSAFALEMFSTIAVAVVAVVIATRLVFGQMDFTTALFVLILAPEVYLPLRQVGTHYHDSAEGLAAAEAAFAEIDRGGPVMGEPAGDRDRGAGQDKQRRRAQPGAGVGDGGPGHWDQAGAGQALPNAELYSPSILARDVRYTYPGSNSTLGPYDVRIEPGEVVALAGRSGGGKTTLLNCLLGFLSPDGSGTDPQASGADSVGSNEPALLLGGAPSSAIDWSRWRAGIAYVPQTPGMVDGTIADNVRLGCPEASDDQVRQVLAEVGASALDPARSVGEEGEGLSGGERRR
ncbi:MAG: thiol reductant ABC exporter subunit CydD, partial [Propionibacteriaceae bacterium]|nr:thiol reductant ABC exporter subunit CydD [Propionibacteriaceae bacterium]